MSIEAITTDELRAEIVRRQEAERTELRRQLADLEAQAAAIRAKLGIPPKRETKAKVPTLRVIEMPPAINDVKLFLSSREAPSSPSEVAKALRVTPSAAGAVLRALLANGEVIRTGHAKGSRYAMAGACGVM